MRARALALIVALALGVLTLVVALLRPGGRTNLRLGKSRRPTDLFHYAIGHCDVAVGSRPSDQS